MSLGWDGREITATRDLTKDPWARNHGKTSFCQHLWKIIVRSKLVFSGLSLASQIISVSFFHSTTSSLIYSPLQEGIWGVCCVVRQKDVAKIWKKSSKLTGSEGLDTHRCDSSWTFSATRATGSCSPLAVWRDGSSSRSWSGSWSAPHQSAETGGLDLPPSLRERGQKQQFVCVSVVREVKDSEETYKWAAALHPLWVLLLSKPTLVHVA